MVTGFRKYSVKLLVPLFALLLLTGCGVVEGIFETGLWLGIGITVATIILIILIIWAVVKANRKQK